MYAMTAEEQAEVRDAIPTWDWQTDAEKAHARDLGLQKVALSLELFLRQESVVLVRWRALGVDILLDWSPGLAGRADRGSLRTEEGLREAVSSYFEGWDEESLLANQEEMAQVEAWLNESPFRLWAIYDAVRKDLIYELDDRLFGLAAATDGLDMAKLVQDKWQVAVNNWVKARES